MKSNRRVLIIILGISLLFRLLFLIGVRDFKDIIDLSVYEQYGMRILSDGVFYNDTYQAPGYTYFIALIYGVFGIGAVKVYIAQTVLGVITTFMIYRTAAYVFVVKNLSLAAAAVSILYWSLTLYTGIFLAETLFLFFLISAFYFFLRAVHEDRWLHFSLSSAFLALSALTRSINLVLVLVFAAVYLVFFRKSTRKSIVNVLIFFLIFCSLLSPWVVRNYLKTGYFVPVDSLGGINLYIGNNPRATGFVMDITGEYPPGSAEYRDIYFRDKAVRYMTEHPLNTAELTLRRLLILSLYDFIEIDWVLNRFLDGHPVFSSIPFSAQGLIAIIAITGLLCLIIGKTIKKRRGIRSYRKFMILSISCIAAAGGMAVLYCIWFITGNVFNTYFSGTVFPETWTVTAPFRETWYQMLIYFSGIIYFILGVSGLKGLIKTSKGRLVFMMIVYYVLLTSLFYIQNRYRLPIMLFMAFPAAISTGRLVSRAKNYLSGQQNSY